TGDSEDVVPVQLRVTRGELSMESTDGLTFVDGYEGSLLEFSGTVEDINAALETLRYRTTRAETVDFEITLTDPGLVYFPGNGHIYEVVYDSEGVDFNTAQTSAAGMDRNG